MTDSTPKKSINKKVLVLSILLFVLPFIASLTVLLPIYSLVGSSLSEPEITTRLNRAEMAMNFILFILFPLSWIAAIALLIKKVRT